MSYDCVICGGPPCTCEESDPSGLQAGQAGAKFDHGKIMAGLLKDFGLPPSGPGRPGHRWCPKIFAGRGEGGRGWREQV